MASFNDPFLRDLEDLDASDEDEDEGSQQLKNGNNGYLSDLQSDEDDGASKKE